MSAPLYELALSRLPGGSTRATTFAPPAPPYAVKGAGVFVVVADAAAGGTSVGLPMPAEVELASSASPRAASRPACATGW